MVILYYIELVGGFVGLGGAKVGYIWPGIWGYMGLKFTQIDF